MNLRDILIGVGSLLALGLVAFGLAAVRLGALADQQRARFLSGQHPTSEAGSACSAPAPGAADPVLAAAPGNPPTNLAELRAYGHRYNDGPVLQLVAEVELAWERQAIAETRYLRLTRRHTKFETAVHNAWMARDLAAVGYALTSLHDEEEDR